MYMKNVIFFLQRVKVIGQEHRAVIHFQLPFAVRLEVPDLIGSRLVIAATHQLAAYFGGFPDFQPFGYWHRFDAERVRLLNIQVVITGGDKHEGGHDEQGTTAGNLTSGTMCCA